MLCSLYKQFPVETIQINRHLITLCTLQALLCLMDAEEEAEWIRAEEEEEAAALARNQKKARTESEQVIFPFLFGFQISVLILMPN